MLHLRGQAAITASFPAIAHTGQITVSATRHHGIYLDTRKGKTIAEDDDTNLNADTAVWVISREG